MRGEDEECQGVGAGVGAKSGGGAEAGGCVRVRCGEQVEDGQVTQAPAVALAFLSHATRAATN
jgi:hypothetical protein